MSRNTCAKNPPVKLGQKYFRLTVIGREPPSGPEKNWERKWICECACGSITSARGTHLQGGRIKSCGCYRDTIANPANGMIRRRHAGSRSRTLWTMYRLTAERYAELLQHQGGGCATCGAVTTSDLRSLNVDHDHACCSGPKSCGKCIRGLLCGQCNSILGYAKDDPSRLRALANYLEGASNEQAA